MVNGTLDGVAQNSSVNAVLTADITVNENVLDANGNPAALSEVGCLSVILHIFAQAYSMDGDILSADYISTIQAQIMSECLAILRITVILESLM